MNMNGIHCQASPIITAMRAPHAVAAQAKSPSPNHCQNGANGPLVVSVSMRKV